MIGRRDLLQIGITLSLAAGLAVAFPRMGASAHGVGRVAEPVCAMIRLTPEDEQRAITIARTAWQLDRGQVRRLRLRMMAEELPELPSQTVIGFYADEDGDVGRPVTGYSPGLLPATLAAPPPVKLVADREAQETDDSFPRKELLWLN